MNKNNASLLVVDNKQLITNYYMTHRDELLAFVSSRLNSSMEAEDIVQNVFLRLLTTDKMITAVTLPALVYTMRRNLMADYYRRHTSLKKQCIFHACPSIQGLSMAPKAYAVTRIRWNRCSLPERSWSIWNVVLSVCQRTVARSTAFISMTV